MEKERKPVVLLMVGGIVFMTLMEGVCGYLAGKWYPYDFLRTVKAVLYVVEWLGIGFGLGLLAHGGRMKGIRISKAYLIAALPVFLIGAFPKVIYGVTPRSVTDWFYEMDLWTILPTSWLLAVAGLLLFMGVAASHEADSSREKKMNLIICVIFLLLLFPIGQLGYRVLQNPDGSGQQIYIVLYVVRFFLFGIAASLTAGAFKAETSWKTASIRTGILCLAISLGWFFLTNWSLYFSQPEILWSAAYCAALMLAAYGGLFLTGGAQEVRAIQVEG